MSIPTTLVGNAPIHYKLTREINIKHVRIYGALMYVDEFTNALGVVLPIRLGVSHILGCLYKLYWFVVLLGIISTSHS
jgi:hypothetical protein